MNSSTESRLCIPLALCFLTLTFLAAPGRVTAATMAPITGINATNTTWGSDNGSSCTGAMWACVDDGTSFAVNDGDHTYVYSQATGGYHTTGYASVSGTVTQVTVHTIAATISGASGNATISLYASGTLQATGSAHTLTTSYTEYRDTFSGLSIPSTSNLQVRVTFSAANLKYTSVWVDASTGTASADPVLAGAGDISCNAAERACTQKCGTSCCDCQDGATHAQLVSINRTIVFTLGDNQYENGEYANYSDTSGGYASTWGKEIGITFPAVGNHEYNGHASCTACGCNPAGCCSDTCCDTVAKRQCATKAYMNANYYQYFSSVKSAEDPNGNGWYSYDVQTSDPSRPWHVIVLNAAICDTARFPSWTANAANCKSGSAQYTWLQQDLESWAASGKKCLLAYWHEPLFSSGTENGGSANYAQFWSLLQSYGVDVIMQGHDHNYERFNPQNSSGAADSTGPISFVVGTGGRDTDTCRSPRVANSAVCVAGTFGTLKLTLHPTSWDFDFESAAGTAASDLRSGIACHN